MIEIISATRHSESTFWQKSALGLSLRRLSIDQRLVPHIFFANKRGLPEIYNSRIQADSKNDILVFVHDDVWIDDYFITERVVTGLKHFEVIGVAGNRHRVSNQPGWAFVDDEFTWDNKENLSGRIAHGKQPFGKISAFGPSPAQCELLDGVFLAAKRSTLVEKNVTFDPSFDFHFYDMDFCRTARDRKLKLGTWDICLTHQSGGAFGTPTWRKKLDTYRKKWGS